MNPVETAQSSVSPYHHIEETQRSMRAAGRPEEAEKTNGAKDAKPVSGLHPESGGNEEPKTHRTPRYDEYVRGDSESARDKKEKKPDDAAGPETERCTVNTDRVDGEIRKLKEELQKLDKEIRQREPGDEQLAALEQRRDRIEAELDSKDNDTYRKQHATVTNG